MLDTYDTQHLVYLEIYQRGNHSVRAIKHRMRVTFLQILTLEKDPFHRRDLVTPAMQQLFLSLLLRMTMMVLSNFNAT